MKRLTDQQFDRRILEVKTRLEQTVIRHAKLLEHLRPDCPRAWMEEETRADELHISAESFKH